MLEKERRRRRRENKMPGDIFQGLLGEIATAPPLFTPRRPETPELRFLTELFMNAVNILRTGPNQSSKDDPYFETRLWVRSTDNSWPCYFEPVCDRLGLDVDATRAALLAIPRNSAEPGEAARLIAQREKRGWNNRPVLNKPHRAA